MATNNTDTVVDYRLSQNPTQPFRMRFRKANAQELVDKIQAFAEKEKRSFPNAIEVLLAKQLKIK